MIMRSLLSDISSEPFEVLLSGTSKIPYHVIEENVRNELKKLRKRVTVRTYKIFAFMQKAAQETNTKLSEKNVLQLHDEQLRLLRNSACKKIQEAIQEDTDKEFRNNKRQLLSLITTHSCFYTKSGIKESLHGHENLLIDYWFSVVHDIHRVREELRKDTLCRWPNITLSELIEWRDRDFNVSQNFADSRGIKQLFLLTLREPVDTFLNIISKPKMPRAYCSYPMSHAGSDTEQKVNEFILKLRKHLIVFDPVNVEEYGPEKERLDDLRSQGKRVSYKLLDRIGEETVKRDFQLISQSHMIIVYFPPATESETVAAVDNSIQMLQNLHLGSKAKNLQKSLERARGKAAQIMPLSPGVISEMAEAHTSQKDVYGLWLNKKVLPSPFFKHWCKEFFTSEKDFFKFLRKEVRNFSK